MLTGMMYRMERMNPYGLRNICPKRGKGIPENTSPGCCAAGIWQEKAVVRDLWRSLTKLKQPIQIYIEVMQHEYGKEKMREKSLSIKRCQFMFNFLVMQ